MLGLVKDTQDIYLDRLKLFFTYANVCPLAPGRLIIQVPHPRRVVDITTSNNDSATSSAEEAEGWWLQIATPSI